MINMRPPLFILAFAFAFVLESSYSQQCEARDELSIDSNSLAKCAVEIGHETTDNTVSAKKSSRKIVLKVSTRKNRETSSTLSSLKTADADLDEIKSSQEVQETTIITTPSKKDGNLKVLSGEVLFALVDKIPLFPSCSKFSNAKSQQCFNTEIGKHFQSNFYPERASDDGVSGRVLIQFLIDIKGHVSDIKIKAAKKSKLLEKEITRVISKLPRFIPGKQKGIPVNVRYSLPINLTSE